MNLCRKQKKTHIENRPVVARGEGHGGELHWEFGISKCKVLYTERINKVLLYSTGSYIQYSVINYNGEEYEKECTCV